MRFKWKLKRKLLGGMAVLALLCIWRHLLDYFAHSESKAYHYETLDGEIPNAVNLELSPPPKKSIFFAVTSCLENATLHLSPRETCAVESAVMMNPAYKVYVLFASPVLANTSNLTDLLLAYGNVEFYRLYWPEFAQNTPIEALIMNGRVNTEKNVI